MDAQMVAGVCTMNVGYFLIAAVGIVACMLFSSIIAQAVLSASADSNYNEYAYYSNIRDASSCTVTNDTFCRGQYKICVHGYEYCQRQQCPESFGESP